MADQITLTVPAEYAEDFRTALAEEIASDAKSVQSDRRELEERMAYGGPHVDIRRNDLRNAMQRLDRDIGLGALVALDGDGEIEIRNADPADLFHVCETMARQVVEPRLRRALEYGPTDSDGARAQFAPLFWAINCAERLERAAVAGMGSAGA